MGVGHPDDVGFLSQALNKAFAKVNPEDLVVFALSYPGPTETKELTTGGWYVEGSKLHLLLANWLAAVNMSNIRDVLDENLFLVIVGANLFEFETNEMSQPAPENPSFLKSLVTTKTPHLVMEYPMMLGWTKPPGQPDLTSGSTTGSRPPRDSADSPMSLEERLEKLKELKEKGLITEEDYKRKKKELLDQL